MLPYLQSLQSAQNRRDDNQKAASNKGRAEMRVIDTQQARGLLRSTDAIDAPIFLTRQSIPFIDTGDGAVRPVEQVFEWLPNPDEKSEMYDHEAKDEDDTMPKRNVPIPEIRARFLDERPEEPARFPWNFPELTLPASICMLPSILRHPSCDLLGSLVRYLQTIELVDVCTTACPHHGKTAEKCPDHMLTSNEVIALQRVHQHWAGTAMIAEAGAMTGPHCDTFGFGTYICCGEGEIGLAWSTNEPSAKTKQQKRPTPKDGWAFKVLRRGDAMYLDPGRWHYVFRKPGGAQTMAWSVRVLRSCDLERWLQIVQSEVDKAIDESVVDDSEDILTWRGLLLSAEKLIEQAKENEGLERFGGEKTVHRAEAVMRKAETALKHLL
ncbi:hypothetical protein BDY17DRAFT_301081 [Neohortaea acidophila]|uniref:JmjC domain-containing protein n=1 Tax=Neohortaea acidophila TaxID=245834 RepID=A0A6A6PMU3_9PEZI|nr:uncharacterized protein BDY17DRAFT_301081 [Neohortaea acidophila]KAF2481312.1 hypothetical protein BDY17DRAFT_301081 [Neohortaea acidophila]